MADSKFYKALKANMMRWDCLRLRHCLELSRPL
jgi:hypothetical protein